ncbi:MAG: putative aliphatic sulfonates transport permease protein SsuC [Chroococcidiopsis cubana SAG 39.79]|uniref:ABC transporter permease n=1 Tax=Chroococcidiopsis cubana SAG 39.79 TaxID=388085 RepID=A0AB37U9N4_9CYAN|nr:aliphatic sulfonate ABC transporter permease SsuC [Chroococcidiopsis cubana]MDZ4876620.1 putative aliphatic sulfonates transport permease protein SsuC [Chroococcidiopsis cubana SAG 39.79]PSB62903.1 aliphatic sulfonate ABC transporter permease SsuC [Chroococcidiopsis cubana CCALA 043]RUT00513.1 ABC transporter permease [Chroococcidiopsis cubana SAG 39.79]
MKRRFSKLGVRQLVPWVLPIVLIIVWQILVKSGWLSTRVLPAPTDVLAAGIRLAQSGELWRNLLISTMRAAIGFLLGGSIGFVLGLLNGLARPAEEFLDTSVQMIRNIPHLALIPLVILWFGIGEEAKIFLVALGVFFPIYLNTFHGVRSVDPELIEMSKSYGLHGWSLFRRVIFPGALSSILVGVRYALGIMWLTLIVAETITLDSGVGYMAMNAREFMQTDVVVLSILLYALLGKLADVATRILEKKWLKWNPNYQPT